MNKSITFTTEVKDDILDENKLRDAIYRRFNNAFVLMSIIPTLSFLYLLAAQIFSIEILTGYIGFIVLIIMVTMLLGLYLGRETLDNIINQLIQSNRVLKQKHRTIVEHSFDAIIAKNIDGYVISWNNAAEKLYGYTAKEMLGKPIEIIIPQDKWAEARALAEGVVRGEKSGHVETRRIKKTGEIRDVSITVSPLIDDNDKIIGVSEIARDITEEKKMRQMLVNTEKQAALGIMAGSIGHELSNIVNSFYNWAKILQDNPGEKKIVKKAADKLVSNTEKIISYGKNLMYLSEPVKPKIEKNVELAQILIDTTNMLKESGVLKNFDIVFNLEKKLSLIDADKNLIEQVIRNLEINAAHAMDEKGILTIRAHNCKDADFIEFSISDTGTGIKESDKKHLFEPFFTTKREGKGTGLGMTITKQIVDQHKGYLRVDSVVGVGTTMTVGLPIKK